MGTPARSSADDCGAPRRIAFSRMNNTQRILYATSVGAFTAALLTSLAVLPLSAQSKRTTSQPGTVAINDAEIDTLALRAHTRFLSDDLLRGRDTGSEGEHVAAAYI